MADKTKKKIASIRDVSALAGVSATTVSRVLNNSPIPSPETCRKVLDAVELSGYKPDPLFSSAFRRQNAGQRDQPAKANTIGFLSHSQFFSESAVDDHYYHDALSSVAEFARQKNHFVMFDLADFGQASVPALVAQNLVDGLLIETTLGPALRSHLLQRLPVVFVDRSYVDLAADCVAMDFKLATTEMLDYLWGMGHRCIVPFIVFSEGNNFVREDISFAYQSFYASRNLPVPHIQHFGPQTISPETNDKVCAAYVQTLVNANPRPTAVIVQSIAYLEMLLPFLRQAGISIPDDMSLASMNDQGYLTKHSLAWTSYRSPMKAIGAIAARLLFDRMADPTAPAQKVFLRGQLIERATCAAVSHGQVALVPGQKLPVLERSGSGR